ncbi:hypothetical protein [Paenibacillus sp. y28]
MAQLARRMDKAADVEAAGCPSCGTALYDTDQTVLSEAQKPDYVSEPSPR